MRLAFLGTPEAAVPPLRALVEDGHDVAVVITQPDRKRGRGGALVPSPVKAAALELGLPVEHNVDAVLGKGIELGVVVAFGKLVKAHVLDDVPMVNIHFSLLPRWRGAAPLERAILAGDEETGVCLMALDVGLDTGPVYECERLTIGPEETADELRARLVEAGTAMLHPAALIAGLVVALMSSVIPYSLELEALRRIPPRVFGVLMSLEPAVAALAGLLVLGEMLAPLQWLAICFVVVASVGAARSHRPADPPSGHADTGAN